MTLTRLKFACPCCGFRGLESPPYERMGPPPWAHHGEPPYSQRYGMPSYAVCPCCGFEFGNDDEPGTAPPQTFAEYLCAWMAAGCIWFTPDLRPEGWTLEPQLRGAGIKL